MQSQSETATLGIWAALGIGLPREFGCLGNEGPSCVDLDLCSENAPLDLNGAWLTAANVCVG